MWYYCNLKGCGIILVIQKFLKTAYDSMKPWKVKIFPNKMQAEILALKSEYKIY